MGMEIRLEEVTKKFGKVTALDGLTLRGLPSEFLVIVGPSGCGKTTLLRIVAGLELPDSGCVFLDGVLANEIPVGKRNVQMIFQSYALWPHMRVMEEGKNSNLSFPLRIRKWSEEAIGSHVRDIARKVQLDSSLFGRKPDEISAGQKQRVALARAMTTSPGAFMMDEPLTNLDPPTRVKVRGEIRRWQAEQRATVIYVTHIMSDAFALADRIAVMREGRIVQVGTAEELIESPADDFVRDYLNS